MCKQKADEIKSVIEDLEIGSEDSDSVKEESSEDHSIEVPSPVMENHD